ncbi:unnamed protein product [Brugia timori]|uniref:Reverse transcriptase domain-containing protein n=1 Tax=Brugia timori TaxID=42155 RepID=A0A0R3QH81_9BILA|nr:unnamed protein product [Brugia timori]
MDRNASRAAMWPGGTAAKPPSGGQSVRQAPMCEIVHRLKKVGRITPRANPSWV